jgi:hypothetical protein
VRLPLWQQEDEHQHVVAVLVEEEPEAEDEVVVQEADPEGVVEVAVAVGDYRCNKDKHTLQLHRRPWQQQQEHPLWQRAVPTRLLQR